MKKPIWIMSLIVIVLAGLFSWYWFANYKRVTRERTLSVQGEPRYNPLYALKLSLRALGQPVETHARIDLNSLKLKPDDTLLLYSPPGGLTEAQLEQILAWVESGGHLILGAPSSTALTDEVTLYSKLGISPAVDAGECFRFIAGQKKSIGELCGERFLVEEQDWFDWLQGDSDGYSLGRMSWGDGSITIASTLSFMNNDELKTASSRQLSYQFLADSMNKGRYLLIYSTDMSPLWLLMLKYGWTLLLPALLLLFAWLVHRSQRFGPLQASPSPDRRALLEHISATGDYMFRRHLSHELHLAVLALFNAKLRRRDPMTAALSGELQISALAERTNIEPHKIRQALKPDSLRQKENFFQSIATLIQLRNQL